MAFKMVRHDTGEEVEILYGSFGDGHASVWSANEDGKFWDLEFTAPGPGEEAAAANALAEGQQRGWW